MSKKGYNPTSIYRKPALLSSSKQKKDAHDHLPLGQGELDYEALLRKLDEISFDGCVIVENNNEADLRESLERVRPWL